MWCACLQLGQHQKAHTHHMGQLLAGKNSAASLVGLHLHQTCLIFVACHSYHESMTMCILVRPGAQHANSCEMACRVVGLYCCAPPRLIVRDLLSCSLLASFGHFCWASPGRCARALPTPSTVGHYERRCPDRALGRTRKVPVGPRRTCGLITIPK